MRCLHGRQLVLHSLSAADLPVFLDAYYLRAFECAAEVDEKVPLDAIHRVRQGLGAPLIYTAPEIVRARGRATHVVANTAADRWALGVLALHAQVGVLRKQGEPCAEQLQKLLEDTDNAHEDEVLSAPASWPPRGTSPLLPLLPSCIAVIGW